MQGFHRVKGSTKVHNETKRELILGFVFSRGGEGDNSIGSAFNSLGIAP